MVLPRWTKGAAATALPASLGLLVTLSPTSAQAAAPGPQLRVLSPRANDVLGSNVFNLDVAYQSKNGVDVVAAEVWVNGERWLRRDLEKGQTRGVLSFAVDASTLAAGEHGVVVKVFDAQGGVSSTSLRFEGGNDSGVSEGTLAGPDVSFVSPGNGKRVAGTVELNLGVNAPGGENPFVTFFVDKEFKTLKNYPPYSYAWDTTTVDNGWHTIEAMAYLDSTKATTSRKLRVYVDNPGGNTARLDEIPDLANAAAAPKTAVSTAQPLTIPLPNTGAKTSPTRREPARLSAAAPSSAIGPSALGIQAIPSAVTAAVDLRAAMPANRAVSTPKTSPDGLRSAPLRLGESVTPSVASPVLKAPAAPISPARPAPKIQVAQTTRVEAGPKVSPATPRVATPAALPAAALQIAFDGERIAFDVAPRVEAGLPIAPFRQIFEHTGGAVTWVPETQVVRAINADREVVITVGKPTAQVNGQSISMERPAFIEAGRTIVPLSFVDEALDVDVQYDPVTGRLQITSK